jgi:hypothetical protein
MTMAETYDLLCRAFGGASQLPDEVIGRAIAGQITNAGLTGAVQDLAFEAAMCVERHWDGIGVVAPENSTVWVALMIQKACDDELARRKQ